ncbi:MAG: hypothetical protein ACLS4Z_05490 [Christensenellaceae bacterium]
MINSPLVVSAMMLASVVFHSPEAPENTASQFVRGDRAAKQRMLGYDMLLSDKFVQIIGAHPFRQRFGGFFVVVEIE